MKTNYKIAHQSEAVARAGGLIILGLGLLAALLVGPATPALAADQQKALGSDQVGQILAAAVKEAQARGKKATIAVVDRVGNVLAVFLMTPQSAPLRVDAGRGVNSGLDGKSFVFPSQAAAAIAKAVTGAYLSSGGNAFSTRTASQIVQENFNPGETFQPGGPLFGVQFSQLPCSDFSVRAIDSTDLTSGVFSDTAGPKRSPLGLSADPGGLPLYIDGALVGGIGVIADDLYSVDLNIIDTDTGVDELIALAGAARFLPPDSIRAEQITVDGRSLRYLDRDLDALQSNPAAAPAFATLNGSVGSLASVNGYYAAARGLRAGTAYGTRESGIRADNGQSVPTPDALVFDDGTGNNRFAPRGGTDGGSALTANEVKTMLDQSLRVAQSARAQIRRPLDSFVQITVAVVDTNGVVLGIARTADAPVFGSDVSLQKARTAAFFSNSQFAGDLNTAGMGGYLERARGFIGGDAVAGKIAFSDRAIGNLARPFYPDGINGKPNGPYSRPFNDWSPFSTGLQLDLVVNDILTHVPFALGLQTTDTPARCSTAPAVTGGGNRIANGIQIFAGSMPIYRAATLVGGIGVSGDGIDQDDMVAFLGLRRAAEKLGKSIDNAPVEIRADNLSPNGARLRYVNCPVAPFLNSSEQAPCDEPSRQPKHRNFFDQIFDLIF